MSPGFSFVIMGEVAHRTPPGDLMELHVRQAHPAPGPGQPDIEIPQEEG